MFLAHDGDTLFRHAKDNILIRRCDMGLGRFFEDNLTRRGNNLGVDGQPEISNTEVSGTESPSVMSSPHVCMNLEIWLLSNWIL